MQPVSVDLALGPNYRLVAVSDFTVVPGPGVAVVDVSGAGYLITQSLWMDADGLVGDGGWHLGGIGHCVADNAVSVVGHVPTSCSRITAEVRGPTWRHHFEFDVLPTAEGWYAGCRPFPDEWLDDYVDFGSVEVRIIQR